MTLRRKTWLIISTMFLGLIVILFFLAENILMNGYRGAPTSIPQQEATVAFLILMIVAIGLVFGLATLFLLEKQVLSRLSHLSISISGIGTSGDLSTRVSIPGVDELSILAGTINGMLAALQQSEKELQESEDELRLIFESIADGVIVYDLDGNIMRANEIAVRMHNYRSKEALIGQKVSKLIDEKDHTATLENLKRRLDAEYHRNIKCTFLTRGGSKFDGEFSTAVFKDASGKPKGFVAVIKDITERKRTEEKQQELYDRERGLRKELEAEINKRIEFTRAVVHELKTPLTPMVVTSELLLAELKEKPLQGLAQNIHQGAFGLNQRIDELYDVARGEIGMLQMNPKQVDLTQLLQEIADNMKTIFLRNKQSFNLELDSPLPKVRADAERLRQVVLNLVTNAFKFTPAGEKITLRAGQEGPNLVIEVQDTGPGISKEEQPRLFEPYYRLESDREHISGLGLGLALARSLVVLHGGEIWVNSQKGAGSTFGFSIPLETTAQSEKDTAK